MPAEVQETREGAIVTLTMSNPGKLNAMSQPMRDGLTASFARLNADPAVRAIILTGANGNFSAGADMRGWNEKTVQECRTRLKKGGVLLMREMVAGSKPIVAAVEGYAYGAGLALACAADHLVAATDAKFCCAFTKVAFIPDLALMYTLPRRVGVTRAKQLIALANTIDAPYAEKIGLVDEVSVRGQALELRACHAQLTCGWSSQILCGSSGPRAVENRSGSEARVLPHLCRREGFR